MDRKHAYSLQTQILNFSPNSQISSDMISVLIRFYAEIGD